MRQTIPGGPRRRVQVLSNFVISYHVRRLSNCCLVGKSVCSLVGGQIPPGTKPRRMLSAAVWTEPGGNFEPFMATLKAQSNGPLYINTVTGTLAVDGGLLHLVQRGGDWAGPQPAQAPPRCTKCNSPPINGRCTSFMLFDVAL